MHQAVRDLLLGRQRSVRGWIENRRAVIIKNQEAIATATDEIARWQAEDADIVRLLAEDKAWQEPQTIVLTSDTPITVTREQA